MENKLSELYKLKTIDDGFEEINGYGIFLKEGCPEFYFSLTDEDDYKLIIEYTNKRINEYRLKYNLKPIPHPVALFN